MFRHQHNQKYVLSLLQTMFGNARERELEKEKKSMESIVVCIPFTTASTQLVSLSPALQMLHPHHNTYAPYTSYLFDAQLA